MKKRGFTLIECIIAIALFALIAFLTTHFSVQCYTTITQLRTQSSALMMFNTAFDFLARDLKMAPTMSEWKSKNKNDYTWRQGDAQLRWRIDENKLLRSCGNRSSVVALHVESLTIEEARNGFNLFLKLDNNGHCYQTKQWVRVVR